VSRVAHDQDIVIANLGVALDQSEVTAQSPAQQAGIEKAAPYTSDLVGGVVPQSDVTLHHFHPILPQALDDHVVP